MSLMMRVISKFYQHMALSLQPIRNSFFQFRAVATAPEKAPTKKVKFFELRDHHQSIPRQKLPLEKKVATPYLHGASAIRQSRRRPPDALNVIL